ncbi:hypothetical protein [Burkholderia gladioli]|uniref:hypothetical protein n=1 Tax=Burkholderia gladioli TaxID=28095 RepID=UPI00163F8DCC|nr:hypothetical protein [Burkholderia gladioli]
MIEMLQAVSGLKTAIELARTALAARDDAKITNAIRDMNDRLFDVQQASMLVQEKNQDLIQRNATLQEANLELQRQTVELEKRLEDRERYELHTTARGGIVMRDKKAEGTPLQAVYLCVNCFNDGKHTHLQPEVHGWWLACKEHGQIPSDSPDRTRESMAIMDTDPLRRKGF